MLGNYVRAKFGRIQSHDVDQVQIFTDLDHGHRNGDVKRVRNELGTVLLHSLGTINFDGFFGAVVFGGVANFGNQIAVGNAFDVKQTRGSERQEKTGEDIEWLDISISNKTVYVIMVSHKPAFENPMLLKW